MNGNRHFSNPSLPISALALFVLSHTGTVAAKPRPLASPCQPAAVEPPAESADVHLAEAAACSARAREQREAAATYQRALVKAIAGIAVLPKGPENPWVRKARNQYEPLIAAARAAAENAEREDAYHRFRAADLQASR